MGVTKILVIRWTVPANVHEIGITSRLRSLEEVGKTELLSLTPIQENSQDEKHTKNK